MVNITRGAAIVGIHEHITRFPLPSGPVPPRNASMLPSCLEIVWVRVRHTIHPPPSKGKRAAVNPATKQAQDRGFESCLDFED